MYERTALSKRLEELIRRELDELREEDKLTPDLVFKDPYFLDFLGLRGPYAEKDLEKHEMGAGENTPIGLILCAEGGHEQIELTATR